VNSSQSSNRLALRSSRATTYELFLVHLPDFPSQQFVTHGTTYEAAARNGQEVLAMIIEEYTEEGKVLPEPRILMAQAA
jgi:predicted RNase H-like HicB family nuclease